tara:strand:+ start:317 stop:706 length:390 start_codon:yes stop_codon:yes gene_type:complete
MINILDTSSLLMAQALSASSRIIEAHTDTKDVICRVVLQVDEAARAPQMREAMSQLWQERGFVASMTRDGFLTVDGLIPPQRGVDLMAAVSEQIKKFAMADAQERARQDMTGTMSFYPKLSTQASLTAH